ncbi:hypothetical protein PCANC_20324 [Puccinia coronata f. sp. avenae]|uniref:Uncharacterized protein n=1 Tax=Puccinia coronata f. sp. avenae TaxID=200324 RepID=A0A2N5TZH5_9BASI|nr:hypothetical protein PCANC_20324 [Puccinia coronata f. sp. avenae]
MAPHKALGLPASSETPNLDMSWLLFTLHSASPTPATLGIPYTCHSQPCHSRHPLHLPLSASPTPATLSPSTLGIPYTCHSQHPLHPLGIPYTFLDK